MHPVPSLAILAAFLAAGTAAMAAPQDAQGTIIGSDNNEMVVAAIDDRDRIIGTGHYKGAEHAFMLTPLAR